MREIGWAIVGGLIIIVIFVGAIFLSLWMDVCTWNDDHCEECGGQWVFVNGSSSKYGNRFYYQCEDCGNVIRMTIDP